MVMVVLSFHMNSVIHILADAQLHRQWNVYYDTVNCMEYKFPIRIVAWYRSRGWLEYQYGRWGGTRHPVSSTVGSCPHLARWPRARAPPLLFIMIKVVTKSGARERESWGESHGRFCLVYHGWQTGWPFHAHFGTFSKKWCFHAIFLGQPFISQARKLPLFAGVIFLPKNHHWRELVLVAPPNTWHQRETQKMKKCHPHKFSK